MSHRVTSHSRYRFDFPLGRHVTEDASLVTKPDAPGPLTRAQMVELLWRVKRLRVTGSLDYSYLYAANAAPITGTITVDITLARLLDNNIEADENDVFRTLMGHYQAYVHPFAEWHNEIGGGPYENGWMLITPIIRGLQKDTNGYWLNPKALNQGAEPPPFTMVVDSAHDISWEAGGDEENGFWDAGTDRVSMRILAVNENEAPDVLVANTLNLHGTAVNFPLSVRGSISDLFSNCSVSAHAATIEVVEWYAYATTAGADAWDTATGAPVNGGPGA